MMEKISYEIEEIKMEYLPKVIEINEKVLPENYPFYFYELLYKNYPKSFLIAKIEEKIVGYVMCRVEHSFRMGVFLPHFSKIGHVVSIGILPEYRRLGIGTSLMEKAMDALKTHYFCDYIYLEVRVSNIPAIKFYEKLGFKINRVIKGYYKDGEDAYVMDKNIVTR